MTTPKARAPSVVGTAVGLLAAGYAATFVVAVLLHVGVQVAGGLPDPRPDHTEAIAEMALAMREEVARRADPAASHRRCVSASTPARWRPE